MSTEEWSDCEYWQRERRKKYTALIALKSKVKTKENLLLIAKRKKPLPKYISSYSFIVTDSNPTKPVIEALAMGRFFKEGWSPKNKVWLVCPSHEIENESR